MIIMATFGVIVTTLFSMVAYFYISSKNGEKEEKKKLDISIEKQTDSLNALARSVTELSYVVKTIKDHVDLKTNSVDRSLAEHWTEIQLLRDTRHEFGTWIQAIVLQGQLKNGWKFSKEFSFPKMGDITKGGIS